ncbi:DNA-binding transcriptional regulator, Lrp family [Oribacterium sp. KHPX15]|uniref:Lrp/AsnC family transcriptional regulator n=1 Tax=unclassified Oribacterium TaxID=2629782 RepID=UPI0004E21EE1|nr:MULTISPECIES: Lrp/AsnC family transcriptional regulator [unclassified Oribacterium]SEA14179.1 DNA-binding transcriptional regulator, Lrp family [Oribacterium sp. KHPX15]
MREKILTIIEKNSRLTVKDIANILGESESKVSAEIEAMENEHIICGYHTLINWDKTQDERVDALIEVKVTPQRGLGFDSIAQRIYQYDEVDAVYLMSGSFDFTVLISGKTMKEVASFVSSKLSPMESVLSTATHFVLKKYKDHGTVIEQPRVDERMKVSP